MVMLQNGSCQNNHLIFKRLLNIRHKCRDKFSALLTCYVCSTKIGEISDISKCFENFVSQTLGVLTRIYAAELRLIMPHFNKVNQVGNSLTPTLPYLAAYARQLMISVTDLQP